MISIHIIDYAGQETLLEIPISLNLSLMEVLKVGGYPVLATCGGIALCATCAVEILSVGQLLTPAGDQELDMLDILPGGNEKIRLACQLRLGPEMDDMVIRLAGQDHE